MKFEKGNKLSVGRPKGVPNKRNSFRESLEQHGVSIPDRYFELLTMAMEDLDRSNEEQRPQYYSIVSGLLKEMAAYSFPKLKSVEHKNANPLDGMTFEEKLEAMKQAVKMMEGEIKR